MRERSGNSVYSDEVSESKYVRASFLITSLTAKSWTGMPGSLETEEAADEMWMSTSKPRIIFRQRSEWSAVHLYEPASD